MPSGKSTETGCVFPENRYNEQSIHRICSRSAPRRGRRETEMKKLLALSLAVTLAFSMAACGKSQPAPTEDAALPQPLWAQDPEAQTQAEQTEQPVTEPQLTEPVPEETVMALPEEEPETTQPVQTEPEAQEPEYPMEEKFTPVHETVYAKKAVNIRTQGNINSPSLGKLQKGTSVLRIGTSEDGWSAIYYKEMVCYVSSEYLTTQEMSPEETQNPNVPSEREVDDMVYTVDDVNMREGPGFDRAVLCRVPEFVELHRTAIVSSGWSKVTYKDQVGYISTGYLAEKHPGQSETPEEEEVSETVYTTREVNLRKGPGTDKAIVGRIPEGTELVRTAVTETGWSKVSYNGETGYVSGDYLSTEAPGSEETE